MRPNHPKIPIARDGLRFILWFTTAGSLAFLFPQTFFRILGGVCFLGAVFCAYFFRDPARKTVNDSGVVVAPGDGRILEVVEEPSPYWDGNAKIVRIFLSVFDVHVQRSPITGQVASVTYRKGKFLDARNCRACVENERNSIIIEGPRFKVGVVQIAGLIARRIVCWVLPRQPVKQGDRLGLIRFGSQVDVFLEPGLEVCVTKGERVFGGVSVIAIARPQAGTSPEARPQPAEPR